MNVPYLSQIEADGSGYENCGPSCLTMLLAWLGEVPDDRVTMHRIADYIKDGYYDGDWWLLDGSDYPLMRELVSREYGLPTEVMYAWPDVYARLDAGQPVMILNDNGLLQPREYPDSGGWRANHFILLTGYDPATRLFTVNDPLAYYAPRAPGVYTRTSLEAAVARVGGVYALTIVKEAPAVAPEDQAIVDTVRNLGGDASSVVGWINELGALRKERDDLNGVTSELQHQTDDLHTEVAARTQERDALKTAVATYEPRIAQMEEALRQAVAVAARRPDRIEVLIGDQRYPFIPAAA